MNFQINFSNQDFNFELNQVDYLYDDKENIVLLDINISKDKKEAVNNKIINWLQSPTTKEAESLFRGGYFILHYKKQNGTITIYRDASGIKTGYYNLTKETLSVSTQLHALAKKTDITSFNDQAIAMLLAVDFCFDGYTIYKGINEFLMGAEVFFKDGLIQSEKKSSVQLAKYNNNLGFNANVTTLREEVISVHKSLVSANNVVYLSGGIDSCVMLSALHDITDKKDIKCISYKVKGTTKDETVYAKSIANYLDVNLDIREIDPFQKTDLDFFEETILKLNNPYIGYWIFSTEGDLNTTFFAGQDTRLHTPDINNIDSFVFDLYLKGISLPLNNITERLVGYIYKNLNLKSSNIKALRHLERVAKIGYPKDYIEKYILEFKQKMEGSRVEEEIKSLKTFYELPKTIKSKRHLYNEIIKIKWKEQYTDDIKYMQDIARVSSTYMAMPFYDKQFSEFCSSIPFEYVSKFENGTDTFSNSKVRVNKVVLREAFKDKLNKEVLYRKKAVSETNFLLFEGNLGENIYKTIEKDLNSKESFIKQYKLESFISPYYDKEQKWTINDQNYLMKIYYIGTLCVYFRNIKK